MREEPERRYQSLDQFSEDIRRYLTELLVVARKNTFGYRMGKFIYRHQAGVAILALLLLAVSSNSTNPGVFLIKPIPTALCSTQSGQIKKILSATSNFRFLFRLCE